MAEMVSSVVVGETVNRIFSSLTGKYVEKSDEIDNMERLEMAHIKMEAAIEISNKWQTADAPLLRWQKMLKRAAQECDDTLHKCKQRALEAQEIEQEVRQSSFPKRIARATKTFISSFITHHNNELSSSAVRRFERYADGASEFLRFAEFGGTARQYMFFDPLIGHLLAGKFLWYAMFLGSQNDFIGILPGSFDERGLEAVLLFGHEDREAPEKSFLLALVLRISESTDIVGTIIKCLQSFPPQLKSATEVAKQNLTQLPTQDFSYVPSVASSGIERWSVNNTFTQIFRPNPSCCKEREHMHCSSNTNTLKLSNIFPEPVIHVSLLCHISLSDYNLQRSPVDVARNFPKDFPPLQMSVSFMPHAFPEDLHPTAESSAIEIIDGEEQNITHTNVSLHELEELLLPKAIACLYHKDEAAEREIFWKSKHGAAYLCAGGTCKTSGMAERLFGWCPRFGASSQGMSHIGLKFRRFLVSQDRHAYPKYDSLLGLTTQKG